MYVFKCLTELQKIPRCVYLNGKEIIDMHPSVSEVIKLLYKNSFDDFRVHCADDRLSTFKPSADKRNKCSPTD